MVKYLSSSKPALVPSLYVSLPSGDAPIPLNSSFTISPTSVWASGVPSLFILPKKAFFAMSSPNIPSAVYALPIKSLPPSIRSLARLAASSCGVNLLPLSSVSLLAVTKPLRAANHSGVSCSIPSMLLLAGFLLPAISLYISTSENTPTPYIPPSAEPAPCFAISSGVIGRCWFGATCPYSRPSIIASLIKFILSACSS